MHDSKVSLFVGYYISSEASDLDNPHIIHVYLVHCTYVPNRMNVSVKQWSNIALYNLCNTSFKDFKMHFEIRS